MDADVRAALSEHFDVKECAWIPEGVAYIVTPPDPFQTKDGRIKIGIDWVAGIVNIETEQPMRLLAVNPATLSTPQARGETS